MATPACVCGGALSINDSKQGTPIIVCERCGTYRLRDIPTNSEEQYKTGDYHHNAPIPYEDRFEHDYNIGKMRLDKLRAITGLSGNPRYSLLDVGCANGGFVVAARDAGFNAAGMDLFIGSAPREVQGHLTTRPFPQGFGRRDWDIVTVHDVVEHVVDPVRFIRDCAAVLKRDGYLVIDIPDMSAGEAAEHHFKPSEHIWYFTPQGADAMLRAAGFSPAWNDTPIPGKYVAYSLHNPKEQELVIVGPPGIGDQLWVLSKVEAIIEKERPCTVTFQVPVSAHKQLHTLEKRSDTFLKMVPFIDRVQFPQGNAGEFSDDGVKDTRRPIYHLCANYHMEAGKRLESWHPQYDTHVQIPLQVNELAEDWAQRVLKLVDADKPKIIMYLSSDKWNASCLNNDREWSPSHWAEVGEFLRETYGVKPIIIGAVWDVSYAERFFELVNEEDYINLVGETDVPQATAILKHADLVMGFCCGITMVATHVGADTIMMWPGPNGPEGGARFLKGFQTAWPNLDAMKDGTGWYHNFTIGEVSSLDIIEAAQGILDKKLELKNEHSVVHS